MSVRSIAAFSKTLTAIYNNGFVLDLVDEVLAVSGAARESLLVDRLTPEMLAQLKDAGLTKDELIQAIPAIEAVLAFKGE